MACDRPCATAPGTFPQCRLVTFPPTAIGAPGRIRLAKPASPTNLRQAGSQSPRVGHLAGRLHAAPEASQAVFPVLGKPVHPGARIGGPHARPRCRSQPLPAAPRVRQGPAWETTGPAGCLFPRDPNVRRGRRPRPSPPPPPSIKDPTRGPHGTRPIRKHFYFSSVLTQLGQTRLLGASCTRARPRVLIRPCFDPLSFPLFPS
jgi:hypothetical protein